jgi:hypothetical protein
MKLSNMAIAAFALIFFSTQMHAQDSGAKKYPEGNVNYSVLFNSKNKGIFEPEFLSYKGDPDAIKYIKKNSKDVRIKIVMGFWCEDSQIQVPRMLRVLKDAGWDVEDEKQVKIYGVDENKWAGFEGFQAMNIVNVPTFIVYYNNKEVGRIIETPKSSLEKDLVEILQKIVR